MKVQVERRSFTFLLRSHVCESNGMVYFLLNYKIIYNRLSHHKRDKNWLFNMLYPNCMYHRKCSVSELRLGDGLVARQPSCSQSVFSA